MKVGDRIICKITLKAHWGLQIESEDGQLGSIPLHELSWLSREELGEPELNSYKAHQFIEAKVMALRPDSSSSRESFSASIRQLNPEHNPWRDTSTFTVGSRFKGPVVKVFPVGVMVKHPSGVHAIVPTRSLPAEKIECGDIVTAKVKIVDLKRKILEVEIVLEHN